MVGVGIIQPEVAVQRLHTRLFIWKVKKLAPASTATVGDITHV